MQSEISRLTTTLKLIPVCFWQILLTVPWTTVPWTNEYICKRMLFKKNRISRCRLHCFRSMGKNIEVTQIYNLSIENCYIAKFRCVLHDENAKLILCNSFFPKSTFYPRNNSNFCF